MASDFLSSGSGLAGAAGVGAGVGVGSAPGVSSGVFVGLGIIIIIGGSSSIAVGSAVGATIKKAVMQGSGSGLAAWSGGGPGTFLSEGTSPAYGQPSTIIGVSAGTSATTGTPSSVVAMAAGSSSAASSSSELRAGSGSSQGAATAAAVGATSWESTAQGTDFAIAVHGLSLLSSGDSSSTASIQVAVYASSGVVVESIELLEKRNSVGRAAGASPATFVSRLEEILESSGAGTNDISAVVRSIESSVGQASDETDAIHLGFAAAASEGVSGALAKAIGGRMADGASSGQSDSSWAGLGAKVAVASSSGEATATGLIVGISRSVARAAGIGSAAGVRKGKYLETLVSLAEAEESMQLQAPSVYPVFWSNTIAASGATWDGLPFNSMIEVDGVMYAAGASGLFRLTDSGNDAGTDVPSLIEWDLIDINHSDYKQRTRSLYINAIADGPFTVQVENKQGSFTYQTHLPSSSKTTNHRAPIGRGITSRAMRLTLLQNRYFSVGDINIGIGDTTRRI